MKFSKRFERDYKWYLSVADVFNFDGKDKYFNKKGEPLIVCNPKGLSAKECFYLFDSQGIVKPTYEPQELHKLYKTKGSVNLHIKMYAEDRAKGLLFKDELETMCKGWKAPKWFYEAVEKQKFKFPHLVFTESEAYEQKQFIDDVRKKSTIIRV